MWGRRRLWRGMGLGHAAVRDPVHGGSRKIVPPPRGKSAGDKGDLIALSPQKAGMTISASSPYKIFAQITLFCIVRESLPDGAWRTGRWAPAASRGHWWCGCCPQPPHRRNTSRTRPFMGRLRRGTHVVAVGTDDVQGSGPGNGVVLHGEDQDEVLVLPLVPGLGLALVELRAAKRVVLFLAVFTSRSSTCRPKMSRPPPGRWLPGQGRWPDAPGWRPEPYWNRSRTDSPGGGCNRRTGAEAWGWLRTVFTVAAGAPPRPADRA